MPSDNLSITISVRVEIPDGGAPFLHFDTPGPGVQVPLAHADWQRLLMSHPQVYSVVARHQQHEQWTNGGNRYKQPVNECTFQLPTQDPTGSIMLVRRNGQPVGEARITRISYSSELREDASEVEFAIYMEDGRSLQLERKLSGIDFLTGAVVRFPMPDIALDVLMCSERFQAIIEPYMAEARRRREQGESLAGMTFHLAPEAERAILALGLKRERPKDPLWFTFNGVGFEASTSGFQSTGGPVGKKEPVAACTVPLIEAAFAELAQVAETTKDTTEKLAALTPSVASCTDCGGSGKVTLFTSAEECATCGGSGRAS